jgi:hypothetical protein
MPRYPVSECAVPTVDPASGELGDGDQAQGGVAESGGHSENDRCQCVVRTRADA